MKNSIKYTDLKENKIFFLLITLIFSSLNACHDKTVSLSFIFNIINENITHYFGDTFSDVHPGIKLIYTNAGDIEIEIDDKKLQNYLTIEDVPWEQKITIGSTNCSLNQHIVCAIHQAFLEKKNYENFISILYDLLLIRYDLSYEKNNEKNRGLFMKRISSSALKYKALDFIRKISSLILATNIIQNQNYIIKNKIAHVPKIELDKNHNNLISNTCKQNLLAYLSQKQAYDNYDPSDWLNKIARLESEENIISNLSSVDLPTATDFYLYYQSNDLDKRISVFMIRFSPLWRCLALKKTLPSWYLLVPQGHETVAPNLKINSAIKAVINKKVMSNYFSYLYHESGNFDIQFCDKYLTEEKENEAFVQKFIRMKSLLDFISAREKSTAKLFFADEYTLFNKCSDYAPILAVAFHTEKITFLAKAFFFSLFSITIFIGYIIKKYHGIIHFFMRNNDNTSYSIVS